LLGSDLKEKKIPYQEVICNDSMRFNKDENKKYYFLRDYYFIG
jgi:hypothetical protein